MCRSPSIIFSTKYKTWSYQQGFYQYNKNKIKVKYSPLICKFIDTPVINEEIAKKYGAKWDKGENRWVIYTNINNILDLVNLKDS